MLKGDTAKLEALIKKCAGIRSLTVKMSQRAAMEARRQIRRTFVESRDPYGNAWAPLKLRPGKPLRLTGQLSTFVIEARGGEGFIVRSTAPYTATHQYGATILPKRGQWLTFQSGGKWYRLKKAVIPKRQMIPEGELGPIWTKALADSLKPIVDAYFKAKG